MNPCITQTLYFVNKLKKEFSHLSEKMELCVEILKLTKLNINSVHTFIQIRMPNNEPIIIDFAHDNDVYIPPIFPSSTLNRRRNNKKLRL